MGISKCVNFSLLFYIFLLPSSICQDSCFCRTEDSCLCDLVQIDSFNNEKIFPILGRLLQKDSFKFYKVNMDRPCPFWTDDSEQCQSKDCTIGYCDEEVPLAIRQTTTMLRENATSCADKTSNEFDPIDTSLTEGDRAQLSDMDIHEDNLNKFCYVEDERSNGMHYVNLQKNPERYTGYKGNSAARVWRSIYSENCFKPDPRFDKNFLLKPTPSGMCVEKRVFYRLISGFHSAITISIASHSYKPAPGGFGQGSWFRNVQMFKNRFGDDVKDGAERLKNVYFVFLLEMKALLKAAPYIRQSQLFYTGNEKEDAEVKEIINEFLDLLSSYPIHFDESQLFMGPYAQLLREEFRHHFINISRIMDCVGCDKCRLWGKLQTHGMGTALQILFSDLPNVFHSQNQTRRPDFTRNDLVALFQSLGRYSSSIWEVEQFRKVLGSPIS